MVESEADVVVVGGGVVGASIAYHLSSAGRKVALVERGCIASGCSSATSAVLNVSSKEPGYYTSLNLQGSRLFARLEEELGADLEYFGEGGIADVVEREADWPAALEKVERLNQVPGVNVEVLRTPAAQRLEPALPAWIQGITFCPANGRVNPFKLVGGYLRQARRRGAVVQAETEVQGIDVQSGAVAAVLTSRGRIHTPWVIDAAGLDSPKIGRMVGVTIPLVGAHGQVATTTPVKPFLRHVMRGLFQLPSGNLQVGSNKRFISPSTGVRLELIPGNLRKIVRLFPFLRGVPVQRIWAGVRPWPVDGLPVLGPVREPKGFLVAACHSGVTLADIIGHVIADLVVEGGTSLPIEHYRVERFKGDRLSWVMKRYDEEER